MRIWSLAALSAALATCLSDRSATGTGGEAATDGATPEPTTTTTTSAADGDSGTSGADGSDDGPPIVDLPLDECPDDPDESNNLPQTATPLPSSWEFRDAQLCGAFDGVDYYRIELPDGGYARAELAVATAFVDVEITLLDVDASTILEQTTNTSLKDWVDADLLAPGSYFVMVKNLMSLDLNQPQPYQIRARSNCDPTDDCVMLLKPPPDADCQVILEWPLPAPEYADMIRPECVSVPRLLSCDAGDGWLYPAIVDSDPPYPDDTRIQLCGTLCDDFHAGTPLDLWTLCPP